MGYEMEHYLEYIDNEVWKVIQNGNSKKRISTGKDSVIRILPPVTAAEIQAVEKERKVLDIRKRLGHPVTISDAERSKMLLLGRKHEGAVQQGPVRARVLKDLSAEEKERYKADIRANQISYFRVY
ncbi:hypothetical protein Tco_1530956 [Tanacetum coccineum]